MWLAAYGSSNFNEITDKTISDTTVSFWFPEIVVDETVVTAHAYNDTSCSTLNFVLDSVDFQFQLNPCL